MPLRSAVLRAYSLLGVALAAGVVLPGVAGAATLTASRAAWQVGAGSAVTSTPTTGLFDPFALILPTTAAVPLADGQTLALSAAAQVTQPQNGFPYALSDGFSGDLLIPVDASGSQLGSDTITPGSGGLSAFGFEVVPFSSDIAGPYSLTVTLAGGQSLTQSVPGGDFFAGSTTPAFFGFYGGSVAALTISTNDPNGFAFGNFVDVPEPAAAMLLITSLAATGCLARRRR